MFADIMTILLVLGALFAEDIQLSNFLVLSAILCQLARLNRKK